MNWIMKTSLTMLILKRPPNVSHMPKIPYVGPLCWFLVSYATYHSHSELLWPNTMVFVSIPWHYICRISLSWVEEPSFVLGMCYILWKIDPMYCTLMWEKMGCGGFLAPPNQDGCRGLGVRTPKKKQLVHFWQFFASVFGSFSAHGFCQWFF
jgi:hypothetical protein